jgi:hypothetical protein
MMTSADEEQVLGANGSPPCEIARRAAESGNPSSQPPTSTRSTTCWHASSSCTIAALYCACASLSRRWRSADHELRRISADVLATSAPTQLAAARARQALVVTDYAGAAALSTAGDGAPSSALITSTGRRSKLMLNSSRPSSKPSNRLHLSKAHIWRRQRQHDPPVAVVGTAKKRRAGTAISPTVLHGDQDVLILLGILTAQVADLPGGRVDGNRVGVVSVVRLPHEHRLKPGQVWLAIRDRHSHPATHRQRWSALHGHLCCALERRPVERLPHDGAQRPRCQGFGRDGERTVAAEGQRETTQKAHRYANRRRDSSSLGEPPSSRVDGHC